jgi:hypothetical protein
MNIHYYILCDDILVIIDSKYTPAKHKFLYYRDNFDYDTT